MAASPTTATIPGPAGEADATEAAGRVGRRPGPPSGRAVVGGLLVTVAALVTFTAHRAAGTDSGIRVLVATGDLRPGDRIVADDVTTVSVRVPDTVSGLFGSIGAAVGRRVDTHIGAGEFVLASSTSAADQELDPHQLSLTVGRNRSVVGLGPGDRIDVYATWSTDVTELVVVGARVRSVRTDHDGVVTRGDVTIDLGLDDPAQVEALVHVQATGQATVVRSADGARLGPIGRRYDPGRTNRETTDARP